MKFTQSYLTECLGKTFITKVIKPKIIDELMKTQVESLRDVQPLVDWEKEIREQKKKQRFGIKMVTPERPKISTMHHDIFPCPTQTCRGFVEKGVCGICKISVCLKCREVLENTHACKLENLQSIALLSSDSKPCPKCCAIINRSEGCNHMFCTNCRTHFDWTNMNILQSSTNSHYLHLQRFSENIPLRDVGITTVKCNDTQEFSLYRDRVNLSEVDVSQLDPKLIQCIWHDSNTIRMLKRKKYNEPVIQLEYSENLQELQIKYLLGELQEQVWRRYVYQYHVNKTLSLLYGDILNLYLASVGLFQQILSANGVSEQDSIKNQYVQLVELCNQSFKSVQDEYGGSVHHIRHPTEENGTPPFI
jgi:hypothetical protein